MRMTSLAAAVASALLATSANAQLQVTEIMYNPLDDENTFEWFEVVNTGGTAIDLDGYYLEDDGGFVREDFLPNISNVSSGGQAVNTVINAGQVAVLYDGFGTYNYDDNLFRATWNVPAGAAVIPIDFFPSLNNGGDTIGFWQDQTQVALDADGPLAAPGANIATFNNTVYNFTYADGGDWPASTDGVSIELVGADETVPTNWQLSADGVNNAAASNPIIADGATFINSTDDFGSPGAIQTVGTPPAELIISEIMYNPRSSEDDWEWVEVYNNTGSTIDFAATPYVFDDDDNADFEAANITSGTIPNGSAAVLFNATDVTAAQMEAAWGTTTLAGAPINYIPVSEWTSLTNGSGDGVALWSSFADYTSETTTGQGRSFDNAAASVDYDNNDQGWPDDDGQSSIYLLDLTNAGATTLIPPETGDFNGDGSVDAADYTIWRDTVGTLDLTADADGDLDVDMDDYDLWAANYGTETVASAGAFWSLSGQSGGFDFDSTNANGVLPDGQLFEYPGGGIGSPGFFTAPGSSAAVPEPTAAVLALLAFAGMATRRG